MTISKTHEKIENPKNVGFFENRADMRSIIGKVKEKEDCILHLYLLVDENDGIIADAKFLAMGPPALIASAEVACDLLVRKNYDQAKRITADLLDKQLEHTFSKEAYQTVLLAIAQAADQCVDIPLSETYYSSPVEISEGGLYPGWIDLDKDKKIGAIEEIISSEIRPYIQLDEGDIEIVDLIANRELIIAYQGACTSCYSATGSTLNAIQQILRARIHPELTVTPHL